MVEFKTKARAAALAAVGLAGFASVASAQDVYRPLTVNHGHRPVVYTPVPADPYNPYAGSGVIVTGPTHLASSAVGAPFQVVNSVFPYQGNTPLILVGAPVHFAGQVAQFPFRVVEAMFGGPDPLRY